MITAFVASFEENKAGIRSAILSLLREDQYVTASQLMRILAEQLSRPGRQTSLDPERLTVIDHGDNQGTIVFVVAESGYQPEAHYAVSYGYGSCGGCDTLESICDEVPSTVSEEIDGDSKDQIDRALDLLMTECLHLVQGLKRI